MPPEDRVRVLHMLEAAEAVAGFIAGRGRAALDADRMLLFALVRAVETPVQSFLLLSLSPHQPSHVSRPRQLRLAPDLPRRPEHRPLRDRSHP
jgi:hypothetical protein